MKSELVTTLKRHATESFDELRFDEMQRRIAIFEGVARGEQAIREGRLSTHAEAKKRLAKWMK